MPEGDSRPDERFWRRFQRLKWGRAAAEAGAAGPLSARTAPRPPPRRLQRAPCAPRSCPSRRRCGRSARAPDPPSAVTVSAWPCPSLAPCGQPGFRMSIVFTAPEPASFQIHPGLITEQRSRGLSRALRAAWGKRGWRGPREARAGQSRRGRRGALSRAAWAVSSGGHCRRPEAGLRLAEGRAAGTAPRLSLACKTGSPKRARGGWGARSAGLQDVSNSGRLVGSPGRVWEREGAEEGAVP